MQKPTLRPSDNRFSCGPTRKRPGWTPAVLNRAPVGRLHRSAEGQELYRKIYELSRRLLEIPDDYQLAITPGSDTGAMEMALWNLLSLTRPVQVLAWDHFGKIWASDVLEALRHPDTLHHEVDYGELPDLSKVSPDRDVVFTWNGTAAGVCVPDAAWIRDDRQGLMVCDATSALFAQEVPFEKLDAITWSWQKTMGGEAGFGMLALSPRALQRLRTHTPSWPIPKLLKIEPSLFELQPVNTVSLLACYDALDALSWIEAHGGAEALRQTSAASLEVTRHWVAERSWVRFLAKEPSYCSNSSICLVLTDEGAVPPEALIQLLAEEKVALDIAPYPLAPPGLRFWAGGLVPTEDIRALLAWLDWGYHTLKARA